MDKKHWQTIRVIHEDLKITKVNSQNLKAVIASLVAGTGDMYDDLDLLEKLSTEINKSISNILRASIWEN